MLRLTTIFLQLSLCAWLISCGAAPQPALPTPAPEPLVVYGWAGYIPQGILDAFTRQSGIPVNYIAYDDQAVAMQQLRAGAEFQLPSESRNQRPNGERNMDSFAQ
jgi:spermidine/putrescine transport system substrate-binding protein